MNPQLRRSTMRRRRLAIAAGGGILLAGAVIVGQKPVSLAAMIPASVDGWTPDARDSEWTPATLHRYIDGGAELYISFGFVRAHSRKFMKAEQPKASITVDVFEMQSSADAFGVFAHSREKPQDEVGQGSEYGGGLLHFWKNRYYVSILGQPDAPDLRATLLKLGSQVAASIPKPGTLPPIVSSLPTEGLRRNTIRYFRHPIWLNSHVYISDDNVLHLGADTAATLARYAQDGRAWILLMVDYPSPARAVQARTDFLNAYVSGVRDGIGTGKDDKWAGCSVRGTRLAAVLSAPDASSVGRWLEMALHTPKPGRP
jgi:hypothetical protein